MTARDLDLVERHLERAEVGDLGYVHRGVAEGEGLGLARVPPELILRAWRQTARLRLRPYLVVPVEALAPAADLWVESELGRAIADELDAFCTAGVDVLGDAGVRYVCLRPLDHPPPCGWDAVRGRSSGDDAKEAAGRMLRAQVDPMARTERMAAAVLAAHLAAR